MPLVARISSGCTRVALAIVGALAACNDPPPEPGAVDRSAPPAASATISASLDAGSDGLSPEPRPSSSSARRRGPITLPPTVGGVLVRGVADDVVKQGAPAHVDLLTPGDEPREPLRYALAENKPATTGMRLDLELQMNDGKHASGGTVPTIGMNLSVRTAKRAADGWMPVHGEVVKVAIVGAADATSRAKLEKSFAKMRGMTIDYAVSEQGQMRDVKVAGAKDVGDAEAQMIDQVSGSFSSLVVPLPTEPVGVGATWQAISRANSGVDVLEFATYRLKSRNGSKIELSSEVKQLAATNQLAIPGSSVMAELQTFTSTGGGEATIDLVLAVPEKSKGSIKTSMAYGPLGGQVTMDTTFVIAFGPPIP